MSGEAVRAVAVLVVATPCPLILAAPIALISGVARAARAGVIVKGGGVVEQLAATRTVLLDKTGTLTRGHPELERIVALDGLADDDVLRLAASVEQYSVHVMARGDRARGRRARRPAGRAGERARGAGPGRGRRGRGAARRRRRRGVRRRARRAHGRPALPEPGPAGEARVLVGVDGALAGALVLGDRVRPDAAALVERLRAAGVRHVAMASGDRQARRRGPGRGARPRRRLRDQTPDDKLALVRSLHADPALRPVVMVGDGINDAPALALADVGIALGRGRRDRGVADRRRRDRGRSRRPRRRRHRDQHARAMHIARQSVIVGHRRSASPACSPPPPGYLPPVAGALFQEAIDVAVILNALRALRG